LKESQNERLKEIIQLSQVVGVKELKELWSSLQAKRASSSEDNTHNAEKLLENEEKQDKRLNSLTP